MAITVRAPLVFHPNPRPKWWGTNPDALDTAAFLPSAAPQLPNIYDSAVPPKKLPPHRPIRMWGSQSPFWNTYAGVPQKRLAIDSYVVNVTALLPVVPPAIVNFFDGVPPPRKLPPHRPTPARSQALTSSAPTASAGYQLPPPKRLPPHIPVRALQATTAVFLPTVLSQLQSEFDAWGMPKKYPADPGVFPNVVLNVVANVVPPPPHGPDYPSKVRLQWTEEAAYPNVAIQPLLIALAQQDVEYTPQGMPRKQWSGDIPAPNIVIEPLSTIPPIVDYEYPSKVRFTWPEDAAFPNVASLPVFSASTAPGFSYDYPARGKIVWPLDAAVRNTSALPFALPEARIGLQGILPAKRWPDYFPFTNWVQETPPLPPGLVPPATYDWHWPRHITLTLDDFLQQVPPVVPTIPIYIPEAGYEIHIAPRLFTIATPIRAFFITVPARAFTISRKSVQTFDVKDPDEDWPLSFNMGPDLFAGETLTGPISVTVTLLQGVDINPSGILNGSAGFDQTSTIVIQPVTGGTPGCSYAIEVTCPTTNPLKTLTLRGILPVQI